MKKLAGALGAFLLFSACSSENSSAQDNAAASENGGKLVLTEIASGLEFPWGLAELPNGDLLVTEREGRLRLISDGNLVATPISGLPNDILVAGQGGLLGILLDEDFSSNRILYLSYSKDMGETNTTAIISAVLADDGMSLTDVEEIFRGADKTTTYHFGSRMTFIADGSMLVSFGDDARQMDEAQNISNLHGAIARINPDGSLPPSNPFTAAENGHPAVYSYGHRNVQGMVYDETRDMVFSHEHGPKGGDEINIVEPGLNYGWPVISYGINYDGTIITDQTEQEGMEQPLVKWVPSIAPSGMAVVQTPGFEDWQGDLLVGAMNGPEGKKLVRIELDEDGGLVGTEDLLADRNIAYRDVISTPNAIYLATADLDGVIYRLDIGE